MPATYTQKEKCLARDAILEHAVQALTKNRDNSTCVRQNYISDLRDFFLEEPESRNSIEAKKIEPGYIKEWERLRNVCTGTKHAEDLAVCYLAGPEPANDFTRLTNLGVLPQNIWSFESDQSVFEIALAQCQHAGYSQPKLLKMSIEKFFETVPIKFDIVYLDSCSSLLSAKHALRCISTLFYHHRLSSPGVLITNFCIPETEDALELDEYCKLLARYFFIKQNPGSKIDFSSQFQFAEQIKLAELRGKQHFEELYSEFITSIVCSVASFAAPSLRVSNSSIIDLLCSDSRAKKPAKYTGRQINDFGHYSLTKFLATNRASETECLTNPIRKIAFLESELTPLPTPSKKAFDAISTYSLIGSSYYPLKEELAETAKLFSPAHMHCFLDSPNANLYSDFSIRQLSYPMHYVAEASKRMTYIAKTKRMFLDSIVFDECRYIYDWIPSAYQVENALEDLSWQYVFRFALDGLIKQRIAYDSESFFSGSVVSNKIEKFGASRFPARARIN